LNREGLVAERTAVDDDGEMITGPRYRVFRGGRKRSISEKSERCGTIGAQTR